MLIHAIHDLSNLHVVDLLKSNLSSITDTSIIDNYHPSCYYLPGNLFYILGHGRYECGIGKYFVMEHEGEFVCGAGWNKYELGDDIALIMTRTYINPKYRTQYHASTTLMPIMIAETIGYKHTWITTNTHNDALYNWLTRLSQGKSTALFNNWPPIYKKFKYIGNKDIYHTDQNVFELDRSML